MIDPKFSIRDKVYVDGCRDLIGRVTAVQWRHELLVRYEVSWVLNGKAEAEMFEEWRLERYDE